MLSHSKTPFSTIIALLILTGQRRGEVASLRRSWRNIEERTVTIPGHITKNGVEHTFPYGDGVEMILNRIPDLGLDYFFPASREHVRGKTTTTYNAWSKDKRAFDKRCGVYQWTLHDLRRTFGTGLAALKVPPHVIEKLLNHKFGAIANQTDDAVSAVAEVYNRYLYMPEMRDAIERWEAKLKGLLRST